MIAVHSHLSLSNAPQTFVHFGKDRTMGLYGGQDYDVGDTGEQWLI